MSKLVVVSCAVALVAACGGDDSAGEPDAGDGVDGPPPDASGPVVPGADPTFGNGGLVTIGFPGGIASVMRVARQPDGKIVGVGGTQESLLIVRVAGDGSFDPSFGVDGVVQLPWGVATNGVMVGYGCAIQPDGKIVAAARVLGLYTGLTSAEVVVRVNGDGTLDPSFGGGGVVVGAPGTSATSVVLQPDGNLVVGGYARLERFLPDGTRDLAFGDAGVATANNMAVADLALQSDGRIVAIGGRSTARFSTTGVLDTTFGTGGSGQVIAPGTQSYDALYSIAIQSDDRIVVGGTMTVAPSTQQGFWVGRYSAAGAVDTSFATIGSVTGDVDGGGVAFGVGVDGAGAITASGFAQLGGTAGRSARFTAAGAVDTTFGTGGAGHLYNDVLFSNLVFEPDGAITAAGAGFIQSAPGFAIALARTTASGVADASFGSGGEAKRSVGGSFDRANAVAFQADRKLLVGGWVYGSFGAGVMRLNDDGSLDTAFGDDGAIRGSQNLAYVTSLAVQPTGKILVTGLSGYSGGSRAISVERYDDTGVLDPTFDGDGVAGGAAITGEDAIGLGMVVAPDGTIFAVGQTATATSATEYAVIALTADGNRVATFGDGGAAMTGFGSSYNIATHAVVQSDGAVVVYGQNGNLPALVRFTSLGVVDAAFGTVAVGSAGMLPFGLAQQTDGSIIAVAGNYVTGAMVVARFTADGTPDPGFGSGGVVSRMFAGNDYYGLYSFMGLVVLPDGKLQLGLASATADGLYEHGVLLRLNADGTSDDTNGPDGVSTLAIGRGSTSIHALAIDGAGKLVAIGRTWTEGGGSDFMAMRFILAP